MRDGMQFDIDALRRAFPQRHIEWHASLDSTMRRAARLAADRCACGSVVGAEEQFAGQGRLGRAWHSERASGVYLSIVLRYNFAPATLPVLTLALGLSVAEAITKLTGLACDLRWPNDVLLASRKCAGILAQLDGAAVIAGIGVNVNHAEFPGDIAQLATSLRLACGREVAREPLVIELLRAIDDYCLLLERGGKNDILSAFVQASTYAAGRRVTVEGGTAPLRGTTAGLDEDGFLLLDGDDGRRHQIVAGGVRPCF